MLISANRKPSAAIAWLLAIIFVPLLGICAFLLVGFGRLPRKRRAKQREVCDTLLARTPGLDRVSHREELVDARILPSGPSFDNDNNLKLFASMIHNARHRVSVTSPYYVPDETIQMAMVTAGSRGLDVELFVSEIGDQFMVFHAQRSYYEQLLRAGVKIYLYRAPTILHAKHLSIDDEVAVIGSSNLDIRSLSLHMELSVLVHGSKFTATMRAVEDDYRSKSRQVLLEDWLKRPRRERVFDNLMRLTLRCNDRWTPERPVAKNGPLTPRRCNGRRVDGPQDGETLLRVRRCRRRARRGDLSRRRGSGVSAVGRAVRRRRHVHRMAPTVSSGSGSGALPHPTDHRPCRPGCRSSCRQATTAPRGCKASSCWSSVGTRWRVERIYVMDACGGSEWRAPWRAASPADPPEESASQRSDHETGLELRGEER